ncbi:hypothetical protein DXA17_17120 [Ruminococcus sp. AM58-7XD]|nr:hypothetical protein DXA17_17120 [Ruminococcus sp. AM58-7XD]
MSESKGGGDRQRHTSGASQKIDSKKRQLPAMGNWRNKNDYDSSVLVGMIMPIGSHTSPEEGQGFF